MRLEAKKYLDDVDNATSLIGAFTEGRGLSDYLRDVLIRSAVERQFEIIGEALSKLARQSPEVAERISDYRRIIGFRNVLVHGYDQVDSELVWSFIETRLSTLRAEVSALLQE